MNANDVAVPRGFRVDVVAEGLSFPTQVTFDERGRPYVTEAGYSDGELTRPARLVRIESGGGQTTIAESNGGPWTGVAFHDGSFYVAEGGVLEGGRILRITGEGESTVLVEGLPSLGDHRTNGPAISPDGWVYFSVGTATNAGVVGLDNAERWLRRHPGFHDTPCRDVMLTGARFETDDPIGEREEVETGAYVPFGTPTEVNQTIEGALPCTGAVMRIRPRGGPVELVAWGFRNPFGLTFAPDGQLYVTDNGYDERGSRRVRRSGDWLWRVTPGVWYGWPDFAAGEPLWTMERGPVRLLAQHPNVPPRPVATLSVQSSSDHLDFSTNAAFGHVGEVFIAQSGDPAPARVGAIEPAGFRVVRVDVTRGLVADFAVNRVSPGPASKVGGGGLERPVAARFDPEGAALYVVDFGVLAAREPEGRSSPIPQTGVLWRITRTRAR